MSRGASLLGAIAALICLPTTALAQTPATPTPSAAPAAWLEGLILVGLAATALAIVAALVAMVRLRRQFALQRDILAAVPQPRQVVGADGRSILANPSFVEFFGESERPAPELLLEQAVGDEEAREQLERLAANARNGVAGYTEIRVRPRASAPGAGLDGGAPPEWRYVAAYPVTGRPEMVFWVIDDITLRRQMEQVIQEEQERFVDLLENAPIGFYSVDAAGNFLFANHTLCDWLGLSYEDLDGSMIRLHDVVANELPEGTPGYDPFGSGDATRGEVALKGADESEFQASISQDLVYDETGAVERTRSVVRHLSREREMVEALERSRERFERFFREAPVGLALLDSSGKLRECNQSLAELTGRPATALAGLGLEELVAPADREAIRRAFAQTPADETDGGPEGATEVRLGAEGETVCALYLTSTTAVDGESSGYIAHFIDTTEQRNLERQFVQSQKMQAVGQLAGGIAHDFNNLLTAMIGFSDLLLLRHRPGDQSFADVMQIKQNANRAANLVRQLLAFSRQQTLQSRLLNVTDILAELSHLLRRLIGENIELEMIHGRDLGTVKADQGQLEQVIINLAVNARDAMPEGGKLTIRTSNETTARQIKNRGEVMPPGDYVRIEVSDSGCGIAPENLDRIFDPFFSTKEVGAGTGLGLSTVYGIVKQTGGFVFVTSEVDRGTTFSIYLPLAKAEQEAEPAAEEAEERARRDLTGRGVILLVEDEDAVRSFGARVLRNKGYEVLEARSGESALEILAEAAKPIDLLVTDVVMPRMDGPSLVRQVRNSRPDLKVIFISGYTEDAFRRRLDEDEAIHFLPKPFSLKQLAAKVKQVLEDDEPAAPEAATGT